MAGKLQGITLEIGGDTKKLNDALKSTNDQIYSTQNELKQVEKLLKLDPKNTELLAQKQQLLGKEISATSDKLEKLKLAEKQAKESGLTNTEDGQKAYRELQREIIATENSLKNFKKQQDDATEKFDLLGQKAEKFNKVMAGLGAGVIALGGAMVKTTIDSASMADEILTLSTQTGLTTDKIQELQYASELIDVPLETMTKSLAKLTKNMSSAKGGSKAINEVFTQLGVSIIDVDGNLRNNQDVFTDVINKLGELENETERDAISMQIFGKSAQDLNPLIEAGGDALDKFSKQAKEMGYVLDEEALSKLGAVDDEIQELKNQFNSTTKTIGADLSDILIPVLQAIQDLLKWFTDNGDGIVILLGSISAGLLAFNVVTMIQGLVKAFQAWKVATEGMTIAQALLNAVMSANPVGLIIAGITAVITAVVLLWNKCEWFRNGVKSIFDFIKGLIDAYIEYSKAFFEVVKNVLVSIADFFKEVISWVVGYITDPIGTIRELLKSLLPKILEWAKDMIANIKKGFDKVKELGLYLVQGLFNGIKDATTWLYDKLKGWVSSVLDYIKGLFGIKSPSKVMRDEVGKYLAQGIGVGFEKEMPSVIDDMSNACKEISNALQTELDINAMPNINKQVTAQNYYTTKTYQSSTEIVRQPSEVIMQIDKTQFGRVVVPAYNSQSRIVGVNLQ